MTHYAAHWRKTIAIVTIKEQITEGVWNRAVHFFFVGNGSHALIESVSLRKFVGVAPGPLWRRARLEPIGPIG